MENIMSTTHLPSSAAPVTEARSLALPAIAGRFEAAGKFILRYGLVLILFWIGGMKFTSVEAHNIRTFVDSSPLFSWTYPEFGIQGLSNTLGVIEIILGLMIAARPWLPRVSAAGSLLAVGMFLSTLSFLATTPAAWVSGFEGFPALGVPGQFVLKDVALLGIAVWSFGEALRAGRRGSVTG
jgi:uncharacterized membrane protein YkgB